MVTYKTPGVYVQEISTLPPSVADVSTAIPAFIGYTVAGKQVARINTLLEYETIFGKAKPGKFIAKTQPNAATSLTEVVAIQRDVAATDAEFLMYYSLSLYFKNGGGSCYIVSIGDYNATPVKSDFEAGLAELEKEDEPTLILLTDAGNLAAADYYDLSQQALAQAGKLGDRFVILNVLNGDVAAFRNLIGTNNLRYGAAYHPYLQTSLSYQYQEDLVQIQAVGAPNAMGAVATWKKTFGDNGIAVGYAGSDADLPKVKIMAGTQGAAVDFSSAAQLLTISNVAGETGADVVTAWNTWKNANQAQGFDISQNGDGSGTVPHTNNANVDLTKLTPAAPANTLAAIRSTNTALYNQIKTLMTQQWVVLPPAVAVAGVYAAVDRDRGVWKAPANVSLASVIGPVAKITNDEQENLNIDPTAGKSINAIRAFTGKGTLVWGARTLAGNDNEWRYVSVRRLFNMIEESTQKATGFAVFEPNDAATWLKVKAMIETQKVYNRVQAETRSLVEELRGLTVREGTSLGKPNSVTPSATATRRWPSAALTRANTLPSGILNVSRKVNGCFSSPTSHALTLAVGSAKPFGMPSLVMRTSRLPPATKATTALMSLWARLPSGIALPWRRTGAPESATSQTRTLSPRS